MSKIIKVLIPALAAAALVFGSVGAGLASECVNCHTNKEKLKKLTAELAKKRPTAAEMAELRQGLNMGGQAKVKRGWERLYVAKAMFDDENHGDIACEDCHKGNPDKADFRQAHGGLSRDPSWSNADGSGICAECHEAEAENYRNGLHYTAAGMKADVMVRAGKSPDIRKAAMRGFDYSCAQCHSSCGHCHVSRPKASGGGLLDGHKYIAKPAVDETCGGCHGGTVINEYNGRLPGTKPDVHLTKAEFGCQDCHNKETFHGTDKVYPNAAAAPGPSCVECHDDIYEDGAENLSIHRDHKDKAACQVCHSQAYQNCFGCHTGRKKGQTFYKLDSSKVGFFIGRNVAPTKRRPEKFVVVRGTPGTANTFQHFIGGKLPNFDARPTFAMSAPHNIQRRTPQASACNNCHGNQAVFLKGSDMPSNVRRANRKVMAIGSKIIPAKIREEKHD